MILEADRLGCLREVLVITAALSIQDPRERPVEQRARADQLHARFRDPRSDFMAWLNLWRHLRTQQKEMGSSAFRRMCRQEHLNYLRVREWQDFESQLRQVAKQVGLKPGTPADGARRRRDPPGAALRAALPHRAARRRPTRLPRCARGPVRDLPRLRAVQVPARPRDGRRAGRDLAPLGTAERRHRPAVGRAARRRPGQAHLLRAVLVEEARVGPRPRARHPVRRTAGRRPRRTPRPAPARRRARAVRPARARAGGVARPAPLLRDQPAAARGGRRARAPRPPPRHRGRRGDAVRLLRRAHPGRGGLRRALRHLVEAGAPRPAGPAHLRPGDAGARGRRVSTRTTSPTRGTRVGSRCR